MPSPIYWIMLCKVICNSVTGNLEFIFLSNAVSGDWFPEQMKAFPVSVIEWYTNSSSLTV